MSEFKPICIRCGKEIRWGEEMIVITHADGGGEREEYEHKVCPR